MSDELWLALAEPNRRRMLDALRAQPCAVGELAHRIGMGQPQTSKHLRVLRSAGLVEVRADAQRRIYHPRPRALAELDAWLVPYRLMWTARTATSPTPPAASSPTDHPAVSSSPTSSR